MNQIFRGVVEYSFTCFRTQPGTSSRRLADDLSLFPWLALHKQRFRVARSRFIWCFSDRGILKWILARVHEPFWISPWQSTICTPWRFKDFSLFILSVLNSWWEQVKKSAFIFHSHQHHKTGSGWSLNTAIYSNICCCYRQPSAMFARFVFFSSCCEQPLTQHCFFFDILSYSSFLW